MANLSHTARLTPQTRVDLHIHSTASDGCWPPDELVGNVAQAQIELFAVADHDTTHSIAQTEALAKERGIGFIRAVEVSTTLDQTLIHLIAYGIDPLNADLVHLLQENWARFDSVDEQSIHRLIQAGYRITWQEYVDYQNDETRGGWRALNFIIDRGICRDVKDYYRLFSGDMALNYPTFAHPGEVADLIRSTGGTLICAHPGYSLDRHPTELMVQLLHCGIAGFECYSPYHAPQMTRFYVDYCRDRKLLITAGSDCHGGFARRALGLPRTTFQDLVLGPLLDHIVN